MVLLMHLDNAIRQNVDKLNKYSKYLKDLKIS